MKMWMLGAIAPALVLLSACDDRGDGGGAQGKGKGLQTVGSQAPNPAMSAPDQVAWSVFIEAVTPTGGKGTAFETWPSDHDTFQPGAKPIAAGGAGTDGKDGLHLRPAVIPSIRAGKLPGGPKARSGHGTLAAAAPVAASGPQPNIPNPAPPGKNPGGTQNNGCDSSPAKQPYFEPGCEPQMAEEVRRNVPTYNYIVENELNSKSGLIKAFNANFTVNFPVDSVEVKTNWIPVTLLPTYYPGVSRDQFYIAKDMVPVPNNPSQIAQQEYALIAMHVISKQVPNWTWATFEHQANRGRCDFLGCADNFGSQVAMVPPADNGGTNQGTVYAACKPTAALQAMFDSAGISKVFGNYCLKGSQTDFTNADGLAVRLGNSVTENGFVPQASCMTCHSEANINARGGATTAFGFVNGSGQVGPIDPSFYWRAAAGQPPYYVGQPGLVRTAISADFVWSIPFCAYDDVTNPASPAPSGCASK